MFIEITDVTKRLDENNCSSILNIGISKGESVCISGKDKTSFLNIIAGRISMPLMRVIINEIPATIYRKTAFLSKTTNFAPHRTLLENLCLPLKLRGFNQKSSVLIAKEQAAAFGLSAFENFFPCQLNSGVLKRAALAEIGLMDFDVLLLDEPTTKLDKADLPLLIRYINSVRLEGKTVILATDDCRLADLLTERTIFIESVGKAVALSV